MKLKLKNDSGMVREVPVGFSWTGFFFQYFVLFARGLFGRAFLLLTVCLVLQLGGCLVQCSSGLKTLSDGGNMQAAERSADASGVVFMVFILLPFALIIGLKINKWTARYWLDRGYKPVGAGWQEWGPKWGLDKSSLPIE